MSDLNQDKGSEGEEGASRWMGLTAYQQMLILPPILFLGGTLAIPGVNSHISVAAGALALVLVLGGLFWPTAAGRDKRLPRRGEGGGESQDSDPR
jgi:hypothetical protein